MTKKISVVEVGPRDGFQSVKEFIPKETKISVIDDLVAAGIKHIEIGSFVSPKVIPQMADTGEIIRYALDRYPGFDFFALVPNLKGATLANDAGLNKICYIVSLSESHNKHNVRKTHDESFDGYREIREQYPDMEIELDLVTAFGCPFEGKFDDPGKMVGFLKRYIDVGMKTCCLCDTIGIANPAQIRTILDAIHQNYPNLALEMHFHDTRGLAMLNALTSIECGVDTFQTAVGGLGGSPLVPGSSGNLSTEDFVWCMKELGYDTGTDFDMLLKTAKKQTGLVHGNYSGHQILINNNEE